MSFFFHYIILDKRTKELLFYLVQYELFSEIGLSKANLQSLLNCSHATCSKSLQELKKLNLIKKLSVGKKYYYTSNLNNLYNKKNYYSHLNE